jgi:hypothetical protein
MYLETRSLFMLVVLIGVTGYVIKNVLLTVFRVGRGDAPAGDRIGEMEERLRKIEAATSSLLVDMSSMKEKQRFMTRLQAGAAPSSTPATVEKRKEGELDPMSTQSVPAIPRIGSPRV